MDLTEVSTNAVCDVIHHKENMIPKNSLRMSLNPIMRDLCEDAGVNTTNLRKCCDSRKENCQHSKFINKKKGNIQFKECLCLFK